MNISSMCARSAKLAVEMQLEDLDILLDGLTFASSQDARDERAVLEILKIDYQAALLDLEGRILGLEILRIEHQNRVEFERLLAEDRQAEQDHRLACELVGIIPSPEIYREESPLQQPTKEESRALQLYQDLNLPVILFEQGYDGASRFVEESLPSASSSKPKDTLFASHRSSDSCSSDIGNDTTLVKYSEPDTEPRHITHALCVACLEIHPRFDMLELSCNGSGIGITVPPFLTHSSSSSMSPSSATSDNDPETKNHAYCRDCLTDLFTSALTDTTLFPPRCCSVRIPLTDCKLFFNHDLVAQFEEKELELMTPNPIYCSAPGCSAFIRPEWANADVAVCGKCGHRTCAICRHGEHIGSLCPQDEGTRQLLKTAKAKKWQACKHCNNLVELAHGCFHMICRCTYEFCYVCSKRWRTCTCPQMDERYLFANSHAAEPEPEVLPGPARPAIRFDDLNAQINELHTRILDFATAGANVDGICMHMWRREYAEPGKRLPCNICGGKLRFLNGCMQPGCGMEVCNRCLNNRL
ncbi:hypothetical protein GQ43DRAFT_258454 [Delitschia confertaspora ATCC 74209]|uniref:RBR-type E3 ubiquitin transferase n=1 Tax=Delitschia confertaspora ATCC 74209 TaxID=1513339 RepID=A0A9P4N181_9PLEO|nr:hypothetical protein GQ43DRAFT_258454 [Delitschia confertaspora ATCC 74209]